MVEKFEKKSFKSSAVDLEKVQFDDILLSSNPIIFDTNFLFVTFEFRVDIISELKKVVGSDFSLYIYEGTLDELEAVEKKGDKNKKFLPLISKMLNLYNFKIIVSDEKYIDEQILSNLEKSVLIATNDKLLRQEIRKRGFKVMYLRQKSYLEIS